MPYNLCGQLKPFGCSDTKLDSRVLPKWSARKGERKGSFTGSWCFWKVCLYPDDVDGGSGGGLGPRSIHEARKTLLQKWHYATKHPDSGVYDSPLQVLNLHVSPKHTCCGCTMTTSGIPCHVYRCVGPPFGTWGLYEGFWRKKEKKEVHDKTAWNVPRAIRTLADYSIRGRYYQRFCS